MPFYKDQAKQYEIKTAWRNFLPRKASKFAKKKKELNHYVVF